MVAKGWITILTALGVLAIVCISDGWAQAPAPQVTLAQQIDNLAQEQLASLQEFEKPAAPCDDAQYIRRVYLDLLGVIPTQAELDAFLADTNPDKRNQLVDRLLNDPLHVIHLVNTFDRVLMERRPHQHVTREQWLGFLREHFTAKRSLRELLEKLLVADGTKQAERGAANFYLARNGDPHLITRDIARMYLGRDLQCAQCHDHPLVADYLQIDYHGLLSMIAPGFVHEIAGKNAEDKDVKVTVYLEKPAGDTPFESVFKKGIKLRTGPRLPGLVEVDEAYVYPDQRSGSPATQDVVAKPAAAIPAAPNQSRRQLLAKLLTAADQKVVARNWANRLWALMFGKGVIDPVDMQHRDNPPHINALLDTLAQGLIDCQWDASTFMGQLAKSARYQQQYVSSVDAQPTATVDPAKLAQELESIRQRAEQAGNAITPAKAAYDAATEAWLAKENERVQLLAARDTAEQQFTQAMTAVDKANGELQKVQQAFEQVKKKADAVARSAAAAEEANTLGADPELQQAAANLRTKEQAIKNDFPNHEKAIADKQAVVNTAVAARDAARGNLATAVAAVDAVREAYKAVDQQRLQAREQLVVVSSDHSALGRRQQWLQQQVDQTALQQALASLTGQISALEAKLAAEREGMTKQEQLVAAADQTKQAAMQEQATAMTQRDQMAAQVAERQAKIAQLDRSAQETDKAILLVSQPDPLKSALQTMREEMTKQQAEMVQLTTGHEAAVQLVAQRTTTVEQAETGLQQMRGQLEAAKQLVSTTESELNRVRSEIGSRTVELQQAQIGNLQSRPLRLSSHALRPLTPEQFCWSILRVTGVFDRYVAQERAELEKQAPATPEQLADPAWVAVRQRQAIYQAVDKLRGNADNFVRLYGAAPGQPENDFFATAEQALFAANGGAIYSWAGPVENNPAGRVLAATDPAAAAQTLYLSVLGRAPQ